jgi:uncharacterized protein
VSVLTDVEVRVLGSLIEKEVTTPDYYPLSLNALTNACNQSSNRHPVVHFDEESVLQATDTLRERNLLHVVDKADSRVTKYRQVMGETMALDNRQIAVMCVLMLRGPQTVGEIRTRSNRIYDFENLDQVETTLNSLIARQPALAVRLPRQTGQKEVRYAHLLSGEVAFDDAAAGSADRPDRIAKLEDTIEGLRSAVEDLQKQFDQFKKQFD